MARLILALFCLCASSIAVANEGLDWLVNQTSADGSYSSLPDIATPFQATTEVLRTFHALDEQTQAGIPPALDFVNAETHHNTEYLSRKIIANVELGHDVAALVMELLSHQNVDGGFGDDSGFDSTVLDTAFALQALAVAGHGDANEISNAIQFLFVKQSSDGGFHLSSSNVKSVYVTAMAAIALNQVLFEFEVNGSLNAAVEYLYQSELTDGGWETDQETAAVVPATTDSSRFAAAVSRLRTTQATNGSWGDDVYVTALALRAIKLTESVVFLAEPSSALLSGQVFDGVTREPLGDVTISLTGAIDVAAVSLPTGSFSLSVTEIGNYTAIYSKAGYTSVSQEITLRKLQGVNIGSIELTPNPDPNPQFATISGRITEATSGSALVGATVAISGANAVVVTTDSSGFFSTQLGTEGLSIITVSKDGYQAAKASVGIELGQSLNFSPKMYRDEEIPATNILLTAKILDVSTEQPIAGAALIIEQGGQQFTSTSDENGNVLADQISEGVLKITISAPGYTGAEASVIASMGTKIDLGNVRLNPLPTSVTITGQVTNVSDGTAVAGAKIEVVNTEAVVFTDTDGRYQLDGLDQLHFSIQASAAGFMSTTAQINLLSYQNLELDLQLNDVPVNPEGFGIRNIEPIASSYGAHEQASVEVEFYNNADELAELQMVMEIKNDNGFFKRFPATHRPLPNDIADSILNVPPQPQNLHVEVRPGF